MARDAAQRLAHLEEVRDAIEDALLTSASTDVIRYRIGTREVERSRTDAAAALKDLSSQIESLELAVNGRARNRIRLTRAE